MKLSSVEVGRRVVDVGDVERVLVQRPDRRALVHVDVLDAELLALLQERGSASGSVELPAARAVVPLGGVELDALEAVLLVRPPRAARRPAVAVTRVPAAVDDELVRGAARASAAFCSVVLKPVRVPLLQVRRLEDRRRRRGRPRRRPSRSPRRSTFWNFSMRPVRLGRAEALVGVEALDPALGVLLGARHPVLRAGVPEVHVAVDDEVLLAVLLVHVCGPSRLSWWARQFGSAGCDQGTRIARPRTRPASRSCRASSAASSGYCFVCSVTLPAWARTISSARSL